MSFWVSQGPHLEGTDIYCYCNITGTNPPPPPFMFNITLPGERSTINPSSSVAQPLREFQMEINTSTKALLEYNKEYILCQATTELGGYIQRAQELRVYRKFFNSKVQIKTSAKPCQTLS